MRLTCCDCKEDLPVENFSIKAKTKRGYSYNCKSCHNKYAREIWYTKNSAKQKTASKTWAKKNNVKILARKYNCSEELIIELLARAKCDVCQNINDLNIDHCHTSGKVRGILCRRCNLVLGAFKDDTSLMIKAIDYLKANGQVSG